MSAGGLRRSRPTRDEAAQSSRKERPQNRSDSIGTALAIGRCRRSDVLSEDVPATTLKSVGEVLAYFLQHPAAADSLEGIARWRVQQESVPRIVEQVDQALAWLVKEQLLLREDRLGGASTFRLDPARAGAARRLLRDIAGGPARDC